MAGQSLAESDAVFRTDPISLAARFGDRTRRAIAHGQDPFTAARLAASFAFQAQPDLRVEPSGRVLPMTPYFDLAVALADDRRRS